MRLAGKFGISTVASLRNFRHIVETLVYFRNYTSTRKKTED